MRLCGSLVFTERLGEPSLLFALGVLCGVVCFSYPLVCILSQPPCVAVIRLLDYYWSDLGDFLSIKFQSIL